MKIKNGLNMIFNKTIRIIGIGCSVIVTLFILYLGCNLCVKYLPYRKLNSGIDKLSKNLEEHKIELKENQKKNHNEQIEMMKISKEKIATETSIQNQDNSRESLDSITNKLIFSTN